MGQQLGRAVILKRSNNDDPETFTAIAALTNVTVSVNNETVDITDFDSAGVRELLSGKFNQAVTVTATGFAVDTSAYAALRTDCLASNHEKFEIDVPGSTGGGTYTGTFVPTSFEESGEVAGAAAFSLNLESAGAITFS